MKRRNILGVVFAGVALVALPATALAQFPPDPPSTYYGSATGQAVGTKVVALIGDGSSFVACGVGDVVLDSGNPVYVVDAFSDSQRAGCGKTGRVVRFYFSPTGANPGRLANETSSWAGSGPKNLNLTAGAALATRSNIAGVTSDKK